MAMDNVDNNMGFNICWNTGEYLMSLATKLLKGHIANMEADIMAMTAKKSEAILEVRKAYIQQAIDHTIAQIKEHKKAIRELDHVN